MYGLLGEKLGHSYSKIIHEKLGYEYELIEKRADELSSFILDGNFDGLNVTIPYKKTVMQYCEHLTPLAQRIGAVNTLYFDTSGLIGTNTDYEGLRFNLERAGIDLSGRKVLILGGTGGAGSMARILSEDLGAREIVIASRGTYSQNKLPDTPTEDHISSNISFVAYDDLPQDAEIIINATPVGTYPNITDSPADLSDFDNCVGVCDLIYNPLRTELLIQAKELGIRYTNGLPMLVRQAAAAA
jgi:shikimate dehydrogenase